MKPIAESGLKTFQIIILTVLSGVLSYGVTYNEIIALNATCPGSDSCSLPMKPNTLEHCSCRSTCRLLGTCCVDSIYQYTYQKPLKNIECERIRHDQNKHHYVSMIKSCDPDLEYDKTTEELCNSDAETLNDPFLKIPVTDPITGISYKNYYCFFCNEHFGAEEPILWNPEITIANTSSMLRFIAEGKHQFMEDNMLNNITYSPVPNLYYDSSRKTWVMDHLQKSATDVKFYASIPTELENVAPVCYNLQYKMVSECASDWRDEHIARKCLSYMAVISIKKGDTFRSFRNPHCAICNFESIGDMSCDLPEYQDVDTTTAFVGVNTLFIRNFFIPEETKQTCAAENTIFDPAANKCRNRYGPRRRDVIRRNLPRPSFFRTTEEQPKRRNEMGWNSANPTFYRTTEELPKRRDEVGWNSAKPSFYRTTEELPKRRDEVGWNSAKPSFYRTTEELPKRRNEMGWNSAKPTFFRTTEELPKRRNEMGWNSTKPTFFRITEELPKRRNEMGWNSAKPSFYRTTEELPKRRSEMGWNSAKPTFYQTTEELPKRRNNMGWNSAKPTFYRTTEELPTKRNDMGWNSAKPTFYRTTEELPKSHNEMGWNSAKTPLAQIISTSANLAYPAWIHSI